MTKLEHFVRMLSGSLYLLAQWIVLFLKEINRSKQQSRKDLRWIKKSFQFLFESRTLSVEKIQTDYEILEFIGRLS